MVLSPSLQRGEGSGGGVVVFKLCLIYCLHSVCKKKKWKDSFGSWVICKTTKFTYKNM